MFAKVLKLGKMVLVFSLIMGCLTACLKQSNSEEQTTVTELESQIEETTETTQVLCDTYNDALTLEVWSCNNEVKTMAIAFMKYYPGAYVKYVAIPEVYGSEYQLSVIAAANTFDCPDVVVLDASFAKQFVDSDMLMDLSDLKYVADNLQTYSSTIEMGTNFETGEIRAYSYQNTVGAVFYRRSLATEYFGTDDPDEIQAMMSDMDKFTNMAKTVKEKSGGKTFMVASSEEFSRAILANRQQPWFVDDTLFIDPIVDDYFDIAREFRDNGYDAGAGQWSQVWFEGMNDSLTDPAGNPVQIFCYFLPTWGLPYVLSTNGVDTAGDWACCTGPLPYQWGGTWLGVMENSTNSYAAQEFVWFCALHEENLTNWATGVYTNEYLLAIDPDCSELSQKAGDFVGSKLVVDKITASFDDSAMSDFLGGQNYYAAFAKAAENCRADMVQELDDAIQAILLEAIEKYASGELTKDEAIALFRETVEFNYP